MDASPTKIDLPKLFARYAEIQNASQVAREFGLSRFQVGKLWSDLEPKQQQQYEQKIIDERAQAIEQHAKNTFTQTTTYLQRVDQVKNSLLEKLEQCVTTLPANDAMSIARIKDASAALKNLCTLSDDANRPDTDIFETFTQLQKIDGKQS